MPRNLAYRSISIHRDRGTSALSLSEDESMGVSRVSVLRTAYVDESEIKIENYDG